MRFHGLRLAVFLCLIGATNWLARAADEAKPAPANVARIPGSFQCWMVTGKLPGRYHSPVCEHGLNPVVLIFSRDIDEPDKPLPTLLKKIDELIVKHPDARMGCCSILLNDGGFRAALEGEDKEGEDFSKKLANTSKIKDELEAKLKEIDKTAEFKRVTLGLDSPAGPKDYQLDPEGQVTVLLYNKQVIRGRLVFKKEEFTEQAAAKVLKEVESLVLEVERLSRPMAKRR